MKTNPIIYNHAKTLLKSGKPVKGINIFEFLNPSTIQISSQLGYDMILIENEHVMQKSDQLSSAFLLARSIGITPVVTVIEPNRSIVSKMLDSGALGIILSHAETIEQAKDLVKWSKYPPKGERGLALGANIEYQVKNIPSYCNEANEEILLLLKIESVKGVENADLMMSVDGIDGVVFGPGDLAADMQLYGQWEHQEVLLKIENVISSAINKGLAVEPSIMPNDKEKFHKDISRGIKIFGPTRKSDYQLFRDAAYAEIENYL